MIEETKLLQEIKGDLFTADLKYTLAHCVGNDFLMGKGIAVEFKKRYKNVDFLKENSKGVGTALYLKSVNHNLFYLVTKPYSARSKPTYSSLKLSLIDMFKQLKNKKLEYLAIPKIGSGLDKLEWDKVKKIINEINSNYKINILVYCL